MRDDISIVCIVKDEADKLVNHLPIWNKISSEIIIVDTGSTDRTKQLALDHNCILVETKWLGYGRTKNFGAQHAHNDWILSLDADEVPDKLLLNNIEQLVLEKNILYKLNFHTAIGEKFLNHCGWHPLFLPRLYNKKHFHWNDAKVHETVISIYKNYDFHFKKLSGKIKHYSFDDFTDFYNKMDTYALLRAQQWKDRKRQLPLFRRVFGPLGRFLTAYFFKLGFLDGLTGFRICMGEAKMVLNEIKYYDNLMRT